MNRVSSNAEILEAVSDFGETKARYRLSKAFLLGFMGGLYISLAVIGNIFVNCLVGGGLGAFLGAVIFPVGITLVVLVGGSLFTGDVLKGVALIEHKLSFKRFFANLSCVWLGNFTGAFFAIALSLGAALYAKESNVEYILDLATKKLNLGALEAMCSGFFCNLLVAGALWLSLSTKDLLGKVFAIYLPIMLFVLCGYQHVVANMYYINMAIVLDHSLFDLGNYLRHFSCVSLGNFLSGGIFLPLVYHYIYRKA